VESQWRVNGSWVPSTDANVPALAFADETGKPIASTNLQKEDFNKADFNLVSHKNTDDNGWTYGASFSNLETVRSGGRRQARILDRVRQRLWVPLDETSDSSCSSANRSFELHGCRPGFETHSTCSSADKSQEDLSMVDVRSDAPTTAWSVRPRSLSPATGSARQVKFVAQGVAQPEGWAPGGTRSRSKTRSGSSERLTPALSSRCVARHKEVTDWNQAHAEAKWEPLPPSAVVVPEVIEPPPALPELLQGTERILWEVEQGQSLTRDRLHRPRIS